MNENEELKEDYELILGRELQNSPHSKVPEKFWIKVLHFSAISQKLREYMTSNRYWQYH